MIGVIYVLFVLEKNVNYDFLYFYLLVYIIVLMINFFVGIKLYIKEMNLGVMFILFLY